VDELTTVDIVQLFVTVIGPLTAIIALWIKARNDKKKAPLDAAATLTGAITPLSAAYERRLAELEEANATQTATIQDMVLNERAMMIGMRRLGLQIEEAGLVPASNWRVLMKVTNGYHITPQNPPVSLDKNPTD